jgi:hypothetical protein
MLVCIFAFESANRLKAGRADPPEPLVQGHRPAAAQAESATSFKPQANRSVLFSPRSVFSSCGLMDMTLTPDDRRPNCGHAWWLSASVARAPAPPLDRQICAHLLRLLDDRDCVTWPPFTPFNGEPDLMPALEALHHAGRRIFPAGGQRQPHALSGAGHRPAGCVPIRFGIPEPLDGQGVSGGAAGVGADAAGGLLATGTRLGMGAGFTTAPSNSASSIPIPGRCWSAPPTACRKSTACRPRAGMCRWMP